MIYGLICYFKNKFLNDKSLIKILNLLNSNGFEFCLFNFIDKATGKIKKIKKINKVVELLSDTNYSSIIVSTNKNEIDGFSADINTEVKYYLPYNFNIQWENNNHDLAITIFEKIIQLLKPIYSYFVYNNDFNYLYEELTFTPISSSWLTGKKNNERESYLLNLQKIRKDIGKIIPQLYPVNYFSSLENSILLNSLKSKLNNEWIFEEKKEITKVKYKKIISWDEFEKIKNKIKLDL